MVTILERCAASILHMTFVLFEDSRELARRAGVKRRRLRRWLRAQKAAGNALLAGHEHGARYWFDPEDSKKLAEQFRREHA